eukprot:SAG22_NODE_2530_length_2469_cov_28.528037_2_plen_503_part_00
MRGTDDNCCLRFVQVQMAAEQAESHGRQQAKQETEQEARRSGRRRSPDQEEALDRLAAGGAGRERRRQDLVQTDGQHARQQHARQQHARQQHEQQQHEQQQHEQQQQQQQQQLRQEWDARQEWHRQEQQRWQEQEQEDARQLHRQQKHQQHQHHRDHRRRPQQQHSLKYEEREFVPIERLPDPSPQPLPRYPAMYKQDHSRQEWRREEQQRWQIREQEEDQMRRQRGQIREQEEDQMRRQQWHEDNLKAVEWQWLADQQQPQQHQQCQQQWQKHPQQSDRFHAQQDDQGWREQERSALEAQYENLPPLQRDSHSDSPQSRETFSESGSASSSPQWDRDAAVGATARRKQRRWAQRASASETGGSGIDDSGSDFYLDDGDDGDHDSERRPPPEMSGFHRHEAGRVEARLSAAAPEAAILRLVDLLVTLITAAAVAAALLQPAERPLVRTAGGWGLPVGEPGDSPDGMGLLGKTWKGLAVAAAYAALRLLMVATKPAAARNRSE